MWLFATYLPLFVGDKIPIDDPHWQCYFVLLEITKYSTARVVSLSSAEYLETLIERHHHMLKTFYSIPSSKINVWLSSRTFFQFLRTTMWAM